MGHVSPAPRRTVGRAGRSCVKHRRQYWRIRMPANPAVRWNPCTRRSDVRDRRQVAMNACSTIDPPEIGRHQYR